MSIETLADERRLVASVLAMTPGADRNLFAYLEPIARAAVRHSPANPNDFDGLVNGVLAKVWSENWRVLRQWNQQARLRSYISRVSKNYCLDHVRSTAPRRVNEVGDPDFADVPDTHPLSNPLVMRIATEQRHCIERAKTMLSEVYARIIHLRHEAQLSHQEIAGRLNKAIGYVGTTLMRAERDLKEFILEVCPDLLAGLGIRRPDR